MKKKYITLFSLLGLFLFSCTQTTDSPQKPATALTGSVALSTNPELPLVAYYTRDTVNTEPVTVRVKGKTEDMDIAHTYVEGYGTSFPVFGLYPDYENTIEIIDGSKTLKFSLKTKLLDTEGLSLDLITPVSVTNNIVFNDTEYNAFNHDLYWVGVRLDNGGLWKTIAYDTKGNIRYYTGGSQFARVTFANDEMQIWGQDVKNLTDEFIFTRSNYHHDRVALPNGNHAVLSDSEYGYEDKVIETTPSGDIISARTFGSLFRDIVDSQTDTDIKKADQNNLNKIIYDDENIYGDINENGIDDGDSLEPDFGIFDWAHANSLVYDSDEDIMYFSLRLQGVIAVDWSNWKLIWWMADDDLKTNQSISGINPEFGLLNFHDIKSLEPYRVDGDGLTDGPKNQHALFLHTNGNLGMFDNQGDEVTSATGSRYVEYTISGEKSYTAVKKKFYQDNDLYSRSVSDIDFTGENNLLMFWGNLQVAGVKSVLREIDLESNRILFELKLNPAVGYRADKMPLYPYQDTNKKYSIDNNEKNGL